MHDCYHARAWLQEIGIGWNRLGIAASLLLIKICWRSRRWSCTLRGVDNRVILTALTDLPPQPHRACRAVCGRRVLYLTFYDFFALRTIE